ncbi:MAG: glycosyl hydrolase, partial [Gemmatimonadetes bacterium]|nr:glycosyl hydrolase [Gemmatimonadota bacterium]
MGNPKIVSRTLVLVTLCLAPFQAAHGQQPVTTRHLDGIRARTIGPASMSGRIVDLAVVESDPTTFYVASATGGVYKTTDNGITLEPVFEDEGTHSVGDIAVHQRETDIVWVGTGERASRQSSSWGDGVYKSTDGGETWEHMGLADSKHIGRIAIHPDDPNIVYVAAMGHLWGPNEERGLYKTTDGGETWTRILEGDRDTGAVDVILNPHHPDEIYA